MPSAKLWFRLRTSATGSELLGIFQLPRPGSLRFALVRSPDWFTTSGNRKSLHGKAIEIHKNEFPEDEAYIALPARSLCVL